MRAMDPIATHRPEPDPPPRQGLLGAMDRVVEDVVVLLYVTMITVGFAQVIMRYVFQRSLTWSEEVARYLFVWITFLGAALALERGIHISVDVLFRALPPPLRRGLEVAIHLGIAAFLVVFVVKAWSIAQLAMTERAPATGVPMGLIQLAMPIGGTIMLINSLRVMLRLVLGRKEA
jgi:TRAP-type transport system small permease protein